MSEAFLLDKRSLGYAEDYVPAPDHVRAAREDAVSAGVPAPSNGVTTALTFLAKVLDAKAVVEIGTGTGATGLALFEGMSPQGVLTSIDPEVGWQLTAKQAFRDRQIASQHFRLIAGRPLEVVNNLRDAAYDLVLVNAEKLEYVEHVAQAERLLRPGGIMLHIEVPVRRKDPLDQFLWNWDATNNNEPFWSTLAEMDLMAPAVEAGFPAETVFEAEIPTQYFKDGGWLAYGARKPGGKP